MFQNDLLGGHQHLAHGGVARKKKRGKKKEKLGYSEVDQLTQSRSDTE
jgi:hypothetical protein